MYLWSSTYEDLKIIGRKSKKETDFSRTLTNELKTMLNHLQQSANQK